MITQQIRRELSSCCQQQIQWNQPLAPFTSFGIGGPADAVVVVESVAELVLIVECCRQNGLSYCCIGKGSNIVVADAGYAGVILLLGKALSTIEALQKPDQKGVYVRVGAGCSLARLVSWCSKNSYSGLEFASGIPGSVGGGVVMNAGAWGGEMLDVLVAIESYAPSSGEERFACTHTDFTYRRWLHLENSFGEKRLVIAAEFLLTPGKREEIENRCSANQQRRKGKQPKGQRSAGSFFKNPPGAAAGQLIEAAGLKGSRCGGAMVSPVHANFLVNTGSATAADVKELMQRVVAKVQERSGIMLEAEVQFL